jgi:hypothetical protein
MPIPVDDRPQEQIAKPDTINPEIAGFRAYFGAGFRAYFGKDK